MNIVFKTSINPRIYFHWAFIILLIGVLIFHFNSNPIGLSIAIFLLLLTVLFNPISFIIITEDEVVLHKTYEFVYSKKEITPLNRINRIYSKNLNENISGGGWILTGDYNGSVIFYLITGSYFYQSTFELEFYDDKQTLLKSCTVNVSNNQILKFIEKFERIKSD